MTTFGLWQKKHAPHLAVASLQVSSSTHQESLVWSSHPVASNTTTNIAVPNSILQYDTDYTWTVQVGCCMFLSSAREQAALHTVIHCALRPFARLFNESVPCREFAERNYHTLFVLVCTTTLKIKMNRLMAPSVLQRPLWPPPCRPRRPSPPALFTRVAGRKLHSSARPTIPHTNCWFVVESFTK